MKAMSCRRLLPALTLALMLLLPALAGAVEPDERLDDPALEARARDLSAELRCLVCQNESIDSSNAPLARDLRLLVRERLLTGETDTEVLAHLIGALRAHTPDLRHAVTEALKRDPVPSELLEGLLEGEPVHPRHHDVADDQVGNGFLDPHKRFLAVRGRSHRVLLTEAVL